MDLLFDAVSFIGNTVERVFGYLESHHWIFGLLVIGYIFRLHDKSIHARFDALEKRIDEIRKRLVVDS